MNESLRISSRRMLVTVVAFALAAAGCLMMQSPAVASPGLCSVRTVERTLMASPQRVVPVRVSCSVPLKSAQWAIVSPTGATVATLTLTSASPAAYWKVPTTGATGTFSLVPRGCTSATAGDCVQNSVKVLVRLAVAENGAVALNQAGSTVTYYSGVNRFSRSAQLMRPWAYATVKVYRKAAGATTYRYVKTIKTNSRGAYSVTVRAADPAKWRAVAPSTLLTFKTVVGAF